MDSIAPRFDARPSPASAPRFRSRRLSALAFLAALALAGCDTVIEGPLAPVLDLPPEPRTPVAAVDRLLWAWQHRDTLALQQLFTADFRFAYPASDTLAAAALGTPDALEWFREEELGASARLFVRGASGRPAATAISIVLDSLLTDVPDPRPGRAPRWHRAIAMRSVAGIRLPAGYLRVEDGSVFYAVRGDSAQIPFELQARGVRPDSTWWWIERWEEAAVPDPAFLDYARLKRLYRTP